VGIIGTGVAGRSHALAYRAFPRLARIVAVADTDASRGESFRRRFGAGAAYQHHRDLLDRPDVAAVSVCTPPASHAAIVLDAIHRGKHVLCEKPLTTRLEDLDAIVRGAAERPSVVVSGVFQHREDPALVRARAALEQGVIGRLTTARFVAQTHRPPEYYRGGRGRADTDGGGALLTQGIHIVDALVSLIGAPRAVSATMTRRAHRIETEDTLVAWLEWPDGMVATFDCTTAGPRDLYEIDLIGSDAGMHLRHRPGLARTWELSFSTRARASPSAPRPVHGVSTSRARSAFRLAAAGALGRDWQPAHVGHTAQVRRFLDACRGTGEPPVPPREARRSLEIALAMYESASTRRIVILPLGLANPRFTRTDQPSRGDLGARRP
jgi:predicted dehydrogenase